MSDERGELAKWCERHAEKLQPPVHQEGCTYASHLRQTAKKFRRIAALLRASPPAGWRLVPVEPTEAMIEAGSIDKEDVSPKEIYAAMLDAAPPPPEAGNGDV